MFYVSAHRFSAINAKGFLLRLKGDFVIYNAT